MLNTSNKRVGTPRRCSRCGKPTLSEFCSAGCAVAAETERGIDYFFPADAHEEVRELMKKIERC